VIDTQTHCLILLRLTVVFGLATQDFKASALTTLHPGVVFLKDFDNEDEIPQVN
jgi:hypothetical protein